MAKGLLLGLLLLEFIMYGLLIWRLDVFFGIGLGAKKNSPRRKVTKLVVWSAFAAATLLWCTVDIVTILLLV